MSTSKQKKYSILQANEMYKAAFLIKKTKFSNQNPKLSDGEVHQMTVSYFQNIPKG